MLSRQKNIVKCVKIYFYDIIKVMSIKTGLTGCRKNVEQLIANNLSDTKVYFVFPTDIAATAWAERALELNNLNGAVALERFTAWDKFKGESIKSLQQNKTAIPTTLRKLFATNILERNKSESKNGKPIFTSLVVPSYVDSSLSFKDWIASLLPQLSSWYQKQQVLYKNLDLKNTETEKAFHLDLSKLEVLDSEDKDLLILYYEYKNFLDTNNLFDPAWEKPPFNDDGKIWYIIYPQILADFEEYSELLNSADNVYLVDVPELSNLKVTTSMVDAKPPVFTYDNTREELHALALYLTDIAVVKSQNKVEWQEIALSVPDIETIEPYLTRELKLHNIPYQLRAGKKLSQYPAGRLFSLILTCVNEDFSFDSVRNLVLDKTFPWGDEQSINQLIEFGVKHNCLCSYEDNGNKVDVWQESFHRASGEERAKVFLLGGKIGDEDSKKGLKKALTDICNAKDFSEINKYYFSFRKEFFDINMFSEEANLILSRCITELHMLIQLQEEFGEAASCQMPFAFFCNQLDQTDYLAQSDARGVNIFPYRLAAAAPYKQQIVIDASQSALSITNQPLSFLSDEKRKKLGIMDILLSKDFISLYAHLSEHMVYFSCATKTFNGYGLPHDSLSSETKYLVDDKNYNDAWINEKKYFLKLDGSQIFSNNSNEVDLQQIKFIHDIQKIGFERWIQNYNSNKTDNKVLKTDISTNLTTVELLRKRILKKLYSDKNKKIRISATALKDFTECPLKWLFSRILKIEDVSLEANLMDSVWVGDIYHEIICRILNDIKKENISIHLEENNLPLSYLDSIKKQCSTVLCGFPQSCEIKKPISLLTVQMVQMQENTYRENLESFFLAFCKYFNGSSVSATELPMKYIPDDKNWYFEGRLDCCLNATNIKNIPDGKFIIDFKTGHMPSLKECLQTTDDMSDFQLAMYVKLYESMFTKEKASVTGAGFFNILKAQKRIVVGPSTKTTVPREGANEAGIVFDDSIKQLEVVAQNFADTVYDTKLTTFLQPNFSKIPYETCSKCKFKSMCRTTYSISGEEAN
jgi:hypothetical protein